MTDEDLMKLALAVAREGIDRGQLPFGAVIARAGKAVSAAHNAIYEDASILSHAESNAISAACRALGTLDLSGCTLYATCEPCPMCFGASVLANISRIVFSVRLGDGIIPGFSVLAIANETLNGLGNAGIEIAPGLMREEGLQLFEEWGRRQPPGGAKGASA